MLERPLQDVVRSEEHAQLNFEKEDASFLLREDAFKICGDNLFKLKSLLTE